ncbi:MAG: PDZ domain-containing protein [Zavarzinella sp.]|nr:PDZ domain-containing protein [Zavarzinella sp.]
MTPTVPLGRVVMTALLTIALTALAAAPGLGQNPPDKDKQIAELEKQLAELQAKLKALKDTTPTAKTSSPSEEVIPPSWVNKFQWRCIGPATMGGRITSFAVYEADPCCYWVATASGGLLKTTNNGVTFEHQFDREGTVSIGAVAVAPSDKNVVWVGTGENNPRNSVSYGDGVYKSTDGGKTWKNMGLKASYQIGDIVIHPARPDVVYVGALGRLYGPGGERGLFKTEDGGKTWKNILPQVDDKTGVIDIAMNPANPDTLLVATWERQRDEFDSFRGAAKAKVPGGSDEYAPSKVHGPGGAIYKTTDGGKTFTKLTKGLPTVKLGRIGLDWSHKSPQTVFAIVDTEKAGMGKPPATAYAGLQSETGKDGVLVTGVTENGPSAKAGLKEGDVISAIDGKEVTKYEAMIDEFRKHKPGDMVKFTVTRGKDKKEIELTFAARPDAGRPNIGITPEEAEGGLRITEVTENSPAAKGGLTAGDMITALDDNPAKTRRDVLQIITNKKLGDKLKVTYTRGEEKRTADLVLDQVMGQDATRPYGQAPLGGQQANVQDQQGEVGPDTGGVYKSTDGGETWTRINSLNPRPFYFSLLRVDPTDDNVLYVGGVDLARSTDGGKKFSTEGVNGGVHSDQHAMWIDPKDGRHMLLGTDGGFYVTFDKAARWDHLSHSGAVGQFYHVAVDSRTPYRVYGGLQDNGSWAGPSRSQRFQGPTNLDWETVSWGDGFVCRVDPIDPDIVYSESQDGNMGRRNLRTGASVRIAPKARAGLEPFRFNWNTPFVLSQHNSSIFYAAGNYVFRSLKQGDDLQAVSPVISLTPRGTGSALSESPRNPDIVWAGTDDGAVWLTKDGCKTWTNLADKFKSAGLPGPRWVTSIEASRWADGRCYVVFDAHRSNDDEPYVFVTEDFGQTWKSLRANLPTGPTRVLREDIANPNLLYLGTEFACFASINRGRAWTKINGSAGLPTVAVHEFAQPTTANDLVVATHGRSIWVLDVTPLRQMTAEVVKGKTTLMSPSPGILWRASQPAPFSQSARGYYGQNPPRGAQIDYVLGKKAEKATVKVLDVAGRTVREFQAATEPGYHRLTWDYSRFGNRGPGGRGQGGGGGAQPKGPNPADAPNLNPLTRPAGNAFAAEPGVYKVVLTVDGTELVQTLTIEPDPNAPKGASSARDEWEEERQLEKLLKRRSIIGPGD